MSDLPERIWVDGVFHVWEHKPLPPAIGYREYLRADLAPTVGYSREQMEDALRHFIGPFRSIDIEYYMNSLTPAAEVPIPKAIIDALEEAAWTIAREAIAAWKGDRDD